MSLDSEKKKWNGVYYFTKRKTSKAEDGYEFIHKLTIKNGEIKKTDASHASNLSNKLASIYESQAQWVLTGHKFDAASIEEAGYGFFTEEEVRQGSVSKTS